MAEETVVAASSSANEAKFTQFNGWDEDGKPIVTGNAKEEPKPAESASADEPEETVSEEAADSAAKEAQERKPKSGNPKAEARIKELLAKQKELEAQLEEARKPKETKADSSPAKPAETKSAQPEPTRPKPKQDDKDADGRPKYASYEDWQEDLADWRADQRIAAREREHQARQIQSEVGKRMDEARGRYTDFDSVTKPLLNDLLKPEVSREVMGVLNDSPVLPDLLYTLGGTEATKADFLEACRNNPAKALRVALLVEQEITKELGKGKGTPAKPAGEGKEETPAATKPRAPKPPTEVGGRGAAGEDPSAAAAKSGNFRAFEAEQTRRALASRKK